MTRTWAARIREAREMGRFTSKDSSDADVLSSLTLQLWDAVENNQFYEADRLLKSIHRVMRGENP
jgi:hypothetical protein